MSATPHFDKIALIGFGLIGGSIARAARAQGLAGEIVTTARSEKTRARVRQLGIVDAVVESNTEAVQGADLVILCIPVGACGPVAQEIAPYLKPGTVVSDHLNKVTLQIARYPVVIQQGVVYVEKKYYVGIFRCFFSLHRSPHSSVRI